MRFVALGGIQQWITIRGADRANPVLLIVHGGPGDAQSPLRSIYAVYEKDFTIVQWDQRVIGGGKPGPVAAALLQLLEEDMRTGDRLIEVAY